MSINVEFNSDVCCIFSCLHDLYTVCGNVCAMPFQIHMERDRLLFVHGDHISLKTTSSSTAELTYT